jgi:hypothetical protein
MSINQKFGRIEEAASHSVNRESLEDPPYCVCPANRSGPSSRPSASWAKSSRRPASSECYGEPEDDIGPAAPRSEW